MRNLVSAKCFVSVILSSFSLCGTVFAFFFSLPPLPHYVTLSCVFVYRCGCVVCKCLCVSILLGTPNSRHVSSVILISSPQGTGELFIQQYSLSLQYMATESALLYCLVVCPIDNTDLYLYFHLLCHSPHSLSIPVTLPSLQQTIISP